MVTLILGGLAFFAYLLWWVDRVGSPKKGCGSNCESCGCNRPHPKTKTRNGYRVPVKSPARIDDLA